MNSAASSSPVSVSAILSKSSRFAAGIGWAMYSTPVSRAQFWTTERFSSSPRRSTTRRRPAALEGAELVRIEGHQPARDPEDRSRADPAAVCNRYVPGIRDHPTTASERASVPWTIP